MFVPESVRAEMLLLCNLMGPSIHLAGLKDPSLQLLLNLLNTTECAIHQARTVGDQTTFRLPGI